MFRRYDTPDITMKSFFFQDNKDYKSILLENGIDTQELFSLISRTLGSTECVGEFFREETGRILSTEEYESRLKNIPGEFITPTDIETCIGGSKVSQLVVAVRKETNELIGSTLSYVTTLEDAYEREFSRHYPNRLKEFDLNIRRKMPSPLYNVFGSIGARMDISPRMRLRIILKMLSVWARHMLEHDDTIVPCIAEMDKGVKRGNAFFQACIKDFKVEELPLVDKSGAAVLAENKRSYYNSIVAIFGKDTIIRMAQ